MRIIGPMAALPKAVEKAEILTALFFLEAVVSPAVISRVPKLVFTRLDQAGVFLPLFGREAETWSEYIDAQLSWGNIRQTGSVITLTQRGHARLTQLRYEASAIRFRPAIV